MKNKDLDIKGLLVQAKKITKVAAKHASFIGIMVVLLAYLFVVWKISSLASTEPSDDAAQTASASIPKIDKNAINQIQALEQNNPKVQALFAPARTNPFQE